MEISLLKQALLSPAVYPEPSQEIKFIETHISMLFLTGRYVYKVKKPVNFGFLDFSSLDKRGYFCEQEVKLNRRLAADLYLGVVRITLDDGRIGIDGCGELVEYAVKMRQIPEDLLLDRMLERGEVTKDMMGAIAQRLALFYASAATNEQISSFARPDRIREDTDENFFQTGPYIGITIDRKVFSEIKQRTNDFLQKKEGLFIERMRGGKIRDCHGDLRLEHIFWGETISFFDCIEFNERFRFTDVAADIAFLAMDLDFHRREDLSEYFVKAYTEASGDDLAEILDFYKCYRAYVRGKVESFRLNEPGISPEEEGRVRSRAERYFQLAHGYALKL